MSENIDKKITIKDRLIAMMLIVPINFLILRLFYNNEEYLILLLMVFIQLCVYFCVHFFFKDKISLKDLLYSKALAIPCTVALEFLFFSAYFNNVLGATLLILLLLSILIHYLCTMGNQSIFYSYFQSWEWKSCWKDNDIKRIAGEHQSIIKKSLINFVLTLGVLSVLLYVLYSYNLLNWHSIDKIIQFRADRLAEYISKSWALNLYWYFLLGYGLLFWGMIIYFLIYPKCPGYSLKSFPINSSLLTEWEFEHIRTTSRSAHKTTSYEEVLFLDVNYSKSTIRDMISSSIFIYLFLYIFLLNVPLFFIKVRFPKTDLTFITTVVNILIKTLTFLIPSAIIGTIILILFCIGIVIVNMLKSKKNTESTIYDELNQKMKPWLGFNSRFVSESFINEEYYDFKELYEKTHPKKKNLFYIEYFFSNILNRNVVSLLEHKKLLWLKVLFNWADVLNSKGMVEVDWFEESSKRRKAIIETMPTRNRANFEDPEGDVFTNLEIEEVTNIKPSILLPFYVTGVIYLNVIPYFLIYNVVMLIIFTTLIDIISKMDIALFNILAYGYIGVMILIFMGFLLSIFMNSMAVWMAWKKYYRLQNEGNTDALFFSIFKQRAIYQNINDYSKDENGNTITNNYSRGLYPQFDIEKLDEITQKLSPKYHDLYSKKFPLSMEK